MIHLSFGGILSKWCNVHGFQFLGVKTDLLQCLELLFGDLGLAGIGVFIDDFL
jgi:hypothetical protein